MKFRSTASTLTRRLAKAATIPVVLAFGLMALTACATKTPLLKSDFPHMASPAPIETRQPAQGMTCEECKDKLTAYRNNADKQISRYLHDRRIEQLCNDPHRDALVGTITLSSPNP